MADDLATIATRHGLTDPDLLRLAPRDLSPIEQVFHLRKHHPRAFTGINAMKMTAQEAREHRDALLRDNAALARSQVDRELAERLAQLPADGVRSLSHEDYKAVAANLVRRSRG
jgi:hypothetical protein